MFLNVLGIQSELNPNPIQQMLEFALSGNWDFWWGGRAYGTMDWGDGFATGFMFDELTHGLPYVDYYSPEYNEMYFRMSRALDMQDRKSYLFELEQIFAADPPSILVAWTQNHSVMRNDLEGAMRVGWAVAFTNYTYVRYID